MTKVEFFKYSLKHSYYKQKRWLWDMLVIITDDSYSDEYITIKDGKMSATIDNDKVYITDYKPNEPLFTPTDTIELDVGDLANIKNNVTTTVGRAIVNAIMLVEVLDDPTKIEYINDRIDVSKLYRDMLDSMLAGTVTIVELDKFIRSAGYLEILSKIVNISITEKSMTNPDFVKPLKKKLDKEFKDKYGPDWSKNRTYVAEYEKILSDAYDEYVKDDPSNGVYLSGKIKNNAAKKNYLTFGAEIGFDNISDDAVFMSESLYDGLPKDPKKVRAYFNSIIHASYSRGHETQKGGGAAKDILRATNALQVTKGDCGTKLGLRLAITKDNVGLLVNSYIISNSKPLLIEDINKANSYIGKDVILRSPIYCKQKEMQLCEVCVGKVMAMYDNGISLGLLSISATLLKLALKKMHNTAVKTTTFNIFDATVK